MGIPKLTKTAEEVNREYNIGASERECSPLSHAIDTYGGCHCGFFHEGKPSGDVGIVPNRATRRRFTSFSKGRYALTKEDKERLDAQANADRKRREDREARRQDRKRASVPGREVQEDQSAVAVSFLVGTEGGETKEG